MVIDIDKCIERLKRFKWLDETAFKELCDLIESILIEESTVRSIVTPVSVCGDIHGQFFDLLHLFEIGGDIPETAYIFMGDYVDRGYYSLETCTYLFLLKVKYPDRVTLLRGNHESRSITQTYGFYDECLRKYGSPAPWSWCMNVFDLLPIAALIDDRIFCVHGGLSPDLKTIQQIRTNIKRNQEVPHDGPFCDLLWSDPDDVDNIQFSPRGAGCLFGAQPTKEFCELNGLELICRAHQLVQKGYEYMFPPENLLVTVWSAPNYCYRCNNVASILKLDEHRQRNFITFTAIPEEEQRMKAPPAVASQYFL